MPKQKVTSRAAAAQAPEVRPPRFTGREAEIGRLAAALAVPPALVLVEGEAGIGKTRLVREALAAPPAGLGKVLMAVCPPFRQPLTLGPVVDGLRQAADEVGGLPLSALGGALRPLFPEWCDDLPPEPSPLRDASAAQHRLFRALGEVLDRLGVGVVVLEDAHWADEATLEFLLFLAVRTPQMVSLVISSRPVEVPPGSLLRRLSSHPPAEMPCVRVDLGPLGVADTASLVSSMLDGEPVSQQFAVFLQERTGGLPLAAEESVRLLCVSGQLIHHAGQWERRALAELAVPPTVRDSVLDRVQRLTQGAQQVLQAASVLADPANGAVLAGVAGEIRQRDAGLSEALGSGLLQETGRGVVGCRHVLACQAVYEAIPAPDRRRLHLRAARALQTQAPVPLAALARHFREAEGETGEWCRYTERAADLALAAGDDKTAAALLHDLLTHAALPAATVVRLARKLLPYGLPSRAFLPDIAHHLRIVLDDASLTPLQQAEGRSQLGRFLLNAEEYAAGVAELERAIPGLVGHRPVEAARAMVRLGWPDRTLWPARVHRQWLDRAAGILEGCSARAGERLELEVNRATAMLDLGEESGWEIAAGIPEQASAPEETVQITRCHLNIGCSAIVWGRYAEARRRLEAGLELAVGHEYPTLRSGMLVNLDHLDWLTGAWDGLAERVAAAMEADQIDPERSFGARVIAGLLDAVAGAPGAEQRLRVLIDDERECGRLVFPFYVAAGLARLLLSRGRIDEALALTGEPLHAIAAKGVWLWGTAVAPVRTQALVMAGRREEANKLVTSFARGLRDCSAPAPRAGLAACRAILADGLGDPDQAARLFARAAKAWQALPQPYDALLAREQQARCLLGASQDEAGLVLLADVRRGLIGLGAHGDADRVVSALRERGVAARRVQRGGRRAYGGVLSPRELEVVRLLAAGRTNKEIARVLSRSPKTVETQLASASRKLDVTSRTALVARALETGVISGLP